MSYMFKEATLFNSDISKWDVSRVTDMSYLFKEATAFNSDIWKWDVSRVGTMNYMFWHAKSFNRKLCGISWVRSTARKNNMFVGSFGSISRTVCTGTISSTPIIDVKRAIQAVYTTPTTARATSSTITPTASPTSTPIMMTTSTPTATSTVAESVITSAMTCSKCGTFTKSGRVSCCAPGGAWFKMCGGGGNANVEHTWIEGLHVCKGKRD